MKLKYNHYINIQINSILHSLKKNNQNTNYQQSLLNILTKLFKEKFGKNHIYYFINVFIEPIIFVKEENNTFDYIPIFHFSFLEYVFLDKSNRENIENIINNMYKNNYQLIINSYFLSLHTNHYNFIFEYIDKLLQEKNKVKYIGGDNNIEKRLKSKFHKNQYFENYLYTDFVHDFSYKNRSLISKENMDRYKAYIHHKLHIQTYHESTFFTKIRDELLIPNLFDNEYKICSSRNVVGYEFYRLLKKIISIKKYYIINEASAISFFYLSEDNFQEIMNILNIHIIKSVCVYMDPYSKSSKIKPIYEKEVYYNKICKQIFQDKYFNDIYLYLVGITKNSFHIDGEYSTILLGHRSNSVRTLSIFIQYISSLNSVEDIIKDYLLKKYNDDNIIQKEYKSIYKNYMEHHNLLHSMFLSSF